MGASTEELVVDMTSGAFRGVSCMFVDEYVRFFSCSEHTTLQFVRIDFEAFKRKPGL
jgi:hypothetical protein